MPALAVIGAQWGDEGKGKIVDLLAEEAEVVVRFQGGNNAGHTLVVGEERTVLHLVPAGVLHPGRTCVIGNGVVVDPEAAVAEIAALRARGHLQDPALLKISERAHVVMPYHKAIDQARERLRGPGKIGTTGRGIGPAYEDKMARTGIRFADLLEPATFRARLERNLEEKNFYLRAILGERGLELDPIFDRYCQLGEQLRVHVCDTAAFLQVAAAAGRRILLEGAQGTMLDVDHGTYPYVTSSSTVVAAAAAGSGLPPRAIDRAVGIVKAYTTRVGSGPFPTELDGPLGEQLRSGGDEYGATTGRPRRCGWFDAVVVRQAARLSGLGGLAITKLDVLTGMDPLRVAVAYEYRGERLEAPPAGIATWQGLTPVLEDLPGWHEPLGEMRRLEELPANARRYLARVEALCGVRAVMVSVGRRRDQTIRIADPFAG